MLCPICGAELFPGMSECPECGSPVGGYTMKTATVVITKSEARNGAVKVLHVPQQAGPVKVRIKPGTRNGAKVMVTNAMFITSDGDKMLVPVRVTVIVKNGPLWVPLLVAFLCLSVLLGAWRIGVALVNPEDSGVQSGTQTKQPSRPSMTFPTVPLPGVTEPEATEPDATQLQPTQPTQPAPTTPAVQNPDRQDTSILYYEQRPFLDQLSDEMFENLEAIYDSAMAFETRCEFPNPIREDEIMYLMQLMHTEFPELMQIDNTVSSNYYTDGTTGLVTAYDLPLVLTENEYERQYAAVRQVIDRLVAETQGMNDWEKEKYVFDYIADNCTYSMDGTYAYTPYGTLVDEVAKCDGISLAMKWIMEEMGLTCLCISGNPTVTEVGHAWNMILLDGQYYCVDVTMDVRKEGNECPTLYCALNVTHDWVIQTYILDSVYQDVLTIPTVTTMDKSYHAQNGSFVTAGEDWRDVLTDSFLKAYDSGEAQLFQFESRADFDACLAGIDDEIRKIGEELDIGAYSCMRWYSEEFHVVYLEVTKM